MEVVHGLKGEDVDLILHSPGGSAESSEALVSYLRSKFKNVRVIVPQAAMSAATMIACSANSIMMGKHSFLGPIDPQMILHTQVGTQLIPAQAILDQFELAKSECEDVKKLGSWMPMLGQYGPALLIQCKDALDLSKKLVLEWLQKYMFSGKENAESIANDIASKLADHAFFKSHGRHINRDQAKNMGLIIEDLETDQELQDLVLSIFHSTTHTFDGTPAIKIIENHNGKAFIKQLRIVQIPLPAPPLFPPERKEEIKKDKNIIQKILDKIKKLFS
jgi:hypothetical protein